MQELFSLFCFYVKMPYIYSQMMKKFLLFLLLIPALAKAQDGQPITASWIRQFLLVNKLDTIGLKYSGQLGGTQWFGSTAWVRRYMINKADTNTFSATRYWVEHQPHTWYGDQNISNANLYITGDSKGLNLDNGSIVSSNAQITINTTNRNGFQIIGANGQPIARFANNSPGADQPYTSINSQFSLKSMTDLTPYGAGAYDILVRLNSIGGTDEGFIGKVSADTFPTIGTVNNKQDKIISLPTVSTTRPVSGDTVNRALAKLVFRGDSTASAVAARVKYTDTTAMLANVVHKALSETITGAKTFSAAITTGSGIAPNGSANTDIGAASFNYGTFWGRTLRSDAGITLLAGSSQAIALSAGANNNARLFGATGNLVIQQNGTFTDNGQKLQVTGRIRVTQGLSGTAGTDSVFVHDNTSKEIKLVSATAFGVNKAVVRSSASTLTLAYGTPYTFTGTTATYTLPAVSATNNTVGDIIRIKNQGSGNITVNSNTGSTIYDGSLVATVTIAPGSYVEFMCDGTNFSKD